MVKELVWSEGLYMDSLKAKSLFTLKLISLKYPMVTVVLWPKILKCQSNC